MHRHVLMAFAVLCLPGLVAQSHAAPYDDFAAGVAAYERGEYPLAISALTAAIGASDLAPNLKPTAYLDRARAYVRNGQCAMARPDLAAAATLEANNLEVAESLADADDCTGDFKSAEVEYSAAIVIHPRLDLFFARGRARWAAGDFSGASADFAAVIAAKPDYQYPVLWLAMAQWRAGNDSGVAIAHDAAGLDLSTWPGPVVQLYLGQSKPDAALASATQGDARAMADRQCEADFYVGEWQLSQHNVNVAKILLQKAYGTCRRSFIEQSAAKIEMARLN